LKDLENVLELEEPILLKCEKDHDPVSFSSLLDCGCDDVKHSVKALNSDLTDKSLVVLRHLDHELLRPSSSITSPLANLELETSQAIIGHCVLHKRCFAHVRHLAVQILVLLD